MLRKLSLLLLLAGIGHVHAATPLRVGFLDLPPYYSVSENGNVGGVIADYIKLLLQQAGVPYRFEGYPPKRLYELLAEGKIQLWIGPVHVPQYDGKVLSSKEPVFKLHMRAYYRAPTPPARSIEDMRDRNVSVIRGWSYGGLINDIKNPASAIHYNEVTDQKIGFDQLKHHRIDYFLSYRYVVNNAIVQLGLNDIQYSPLQDVAMHLIVPASVPQAEQLLQKLETASQALKKRGISSIVQDQP